MSVIAGNTIMIDGITSLNGAIESGEGNDLPSLIL